jgi:hypothetical protein
MTGDAKRNALIFLGMVMLITMVIAFSLPSLRLEPGMPLPRLQQNQVVLDSGEAELPLVIHVNEFAKVFFALLLAGSGLYVIIKLFLGADIKDLSALIKPILVICLMAVGIILAMIIFLPKSADSPPMELIIPTAAPLVTSPLGAVPPILLWLVGLGLLGVITLIAVWILNSSARQTTTVDIVGLEAEKAREALRTGLELKDVIVSCYRQMSSALQKEQGIERKESMTTREFEDVLESAGIPHAPVHHLTLLFEAVRYGNWQPNPLDEQKAIQSLEAIIAHCHAVKMKKD